MTTLFGERYESRTYYFYCSLDITEFTVL